MARKRMVTRTISTTHAIIKVYETVKDAMYDISVQYTGELSTEDVFKKARANEECETLKVLCVKELEVETARYGMDEGMFIELAQKLDTADETETQED